MPFKDKVVLVTGASSALGAATAVVFAKADAKVVLVGRNLEHLKSVEKTCKNSKNVHIECLLIVADVVTEAERIIKETIGKFGKLDVLINNTGTLATGGILDTEIEQFDRVLNANLRAAFILTKFAVKYLIETQGSIVNVSSFAGLHTGPNSLSFSVSKAAMDEFTKCVALELKPKNVRVTDVNPDVHLSKILRNHGMSETEFMECVNRSRNTEAMGGRVEEVNDIAETIAFLAGRVVDPAVDFRLQSDVKK